MSFAAGAAKKALGGSQSARSGNRTGATSQRSRNDISPSIVTGSTGVPTTTVIAIAAAGLGAVWLASR